MKEAAGEANMTVITIVLIAVVLGVGLILVPKLMSGTSEKSCCTNSGNVWFKDNCYAKSDCYIGNDGSVQCKGIEVISNPACD